MSVINMFFSSPVIFLNTYFLIVSFAFILSRHIQNMKSEIAVFSCLCMISEISVYEDNNDLIFIGKSETLN